MLTNHDQQPLAQARKEHKIIYEGQSYSIPDACALAIHYQKNYTDIQAAMDIYRLILEAVPNHRASLNNMGLLLYHFEQVDEAIAFYRRAIQLEPHAHSSYNNLGTALLSKGQVHEAEQMFLKALALKPDHARSIYCLVHMRKYHSIEHEDTKRIVDALQRPEGTLEDAPHLYFSLAKIYDDSGLHDQAFACFHKANQLLKASLPLEYNPALMQQHTDFVIETFSKDFLAGPFAYGSLNDQPVFIVGMPRSGTTLLANILSNHPDVISAGELPTMGECAERLPQLLGGATPYPQAARHITPALAAELIGHYESRLTRNVSTETRRIIDKHPANFRYLGLIAMLFPKARILHCTRDPLDTCLSNYFQYFDPVYNYSFDLQHTGHFYREYSRFMHHWRMALPMDILDISYEEMVTDTQAAARKTLAFLGLPWDEHCLSPHANTHAVRTASMWQVRQPIYRQSLERWRHYEKYLEPLKAMLEPGDLTVIK